MEDSLDAKEPLIKRLRVIIRFSVRCLAIFMTNGDRLGRNRCCLDDISKTQLPTHIDNEYFRYVGHLRGFHGRTDRH